MNPKIKNQMDSLRKKMVHLVFFTTLLSPSSFGNCDSLIDQVFELDQRSSFDRPSQVVTLERLLSQEVRPDCEGAVRQRHLLHQREILSSWRSSLIQTDSPAASLDTLLFDLRTFSVLTRDQEHWSMQFYRNRLSDTVALALRALREELASYPSFLLILSSPPESVIPWDGEAIVGNHAIGSSWFQRRQISIDPRNFEANHYRIALVHEMAHINDWNRTLHRAPDSCEARFENEVFAWLKTLEYTDTLLEQASRLPAWMLNFRSQLRLWTREGDTVRDKIYRFVRQQYSSPAHPCSNLFTPYGRRRE